MPDWPATSRHTLSRLRAPLAVVIVAALTLSVAAGFAHTRSSDYDVELARIGREIAALQEGIAMPRSEIDRTTQHLYLLYRRASLTGAPADIDATSRAINRALREIGPAGDLCLIKASLDFKLHRLADAKRDLALAPAIADHPDVQALQADIALQEGRYADALAGYEAALNGKRSWDNLARLAYLREVGGDGTGADALYADAVDEITTKEMRAYAWVEMQRGYRAFSRGRHDDAREHYTRAERAYSGYWQIEEHEAELLAADGRYDEAARLYASIIERTPRPELQQALGDVYLFSGRADQARPWYGKALAAYLASVERGEVQYYHHLAGFYADVHRDGAEAVRWARKDLEQRRGFAAHDAMAWALYRAGRYAEAVDEMSAALAPGTQDAHLFFHAGTIYLAAGRTDEGRHYLQRAAEVNSRFEAFHVHR